MKQRIKQSLILLGIGIAVNVALAIIKMYVGLSSNSLTIMLDATNSMLDIVTSIVSFIAIAVLLAPKSKTAPFVYGRVEYLAAFIVSIASAVMGGLFFIRSLNRLAMPEPVWFGWQNCVLISVCVPVKLALGLFYYFRNKKLKSKAIAAIALDCFLDTGITATSLVAFTVTSQVDYAADAIFGIVMSVVVVVIAVKLIVDNVKCIVRGDGGAEEIALLQAYCEEQPLISYVGDIAVHDYGFGAKVCTAEVVFNEEVALCDIEKAQTTAHDVFESRYGMNVWLVPTSYNTANAQRDVSIDEVAEEGGSKILDD